MNVPAQQVTAAEWVEHGDELARWMGEKPAPSASLSDAAVGIQDTTGKVVAVAIPWTDVQALEQRTGLTIDQILTLVAGDGGEAAG